MTKSKIEDYVNNVLYQIAEIPESCKHLKDLCDGQGMEKPENAALLAKACGGTGKGKYLFICLAKGQLGLRKKEAAEAYEKAKNLPAPETDVSELEKEIRKAFKANKLKQMGFIPKRDGRGYSVNANVFVRNFLHRIGLVLMGEMWFLYNRSGYFENVTEVFIGKLVRNMLNEAVKDFWYNSLGNEIIAALRLEVPHVQELNPRRDLLNLENGMLNVETGKLLSYSPEFLSTVRIPYVFDPKAECTRFLQFIVEVTEGDKQLAALLQEIVGYLLTAETRAEKMFLFFGNGSNGKSVCARVIMALVGEENVSSVPMEKFSQQFGLQPLIGKTVNISSENELSRRLNTENIKAVVSGDKMSISIKYQNDVPYAPTVKLVFLVNTLPETEDSSYGFYRKLLIVPFRHKFTDDEKDVNLFEKLQTEMPGILNWALEGLRRLKANEFRFSKCEAADHAMEEYREEQNAVPRFFADCVQRAEGVCTAKSAVVSAYRVWLSRNGMDDPCRNSNQRFWKEYKLASGLNGVTYAEKKVKGVRFIDGVRLAEEATTEGGIDFTE